MNAAAQSDVVSQELLIGEQRPVLEISLIMIGTLLAIAAAPAVSPRSPFSGTHSAGACGGVLRKFIGQLAPEIEPPRYCTPKPIV